MIDDYGHHLVEISGPQGGARDRRQGDCCRAAPSLHPCGSPLRGFCTCFNDADIVLVADIYAAGEARSKVSQTLVG